MFDNKNIILAIVSLSHLVVHAQMMVFPTLILVFSSEYNLGMDVLGLMAATGTFMFGLGAIPAGILEKKLGSKALLLIYQIGSTIAGLIIILSNSPFQITIGLGVLGISSSIYHPAGLTLLSHKLDRLSRGLAIHGIAGSFGLALGPLIASLASEYGSWRISYLIWISVQIILTFASFHYIKIKEIKGDNLVNNSKRTSRVEMTLYYVTTISLGFAFGGFTTYMPSLFGMQNDGIFKLFSITLKAGIFTTMVFLSGIIGQAMGGYLGDRFDRRSLLCIIIALNIPLMALMGHTSSWQLLFSSILLGVAYFSNQPVSNALLADLTSKEDRGIGYGVSFFLSFGIGGLAPAVSGVIAEAYTIEMIFPFLSICLVPGLIAGLLLVRYQGGKL